LAPVTNTVGGAMILPIAEGEFTLLPEEKIDFSAPLFSTS
jgi:hypothetical protein